MGQHAPDQYRLSTSLFSCRYVHAKVYAVNAIDVGKSALQIHGIRTGRSPSAVGMGGFIGDAHIGFRFGNDTGKLYAAYPMDQHLADQLPSQGQPVSFIKFSL